MVYANDGAGLTEQLVRPTICEVCGGPLGTESWWVTTYPKGVHTACRDWSTIAFPLQRQCELTWKLGQRLNGENAEASACFLAAHRWLQKRQRAWPNGGAEVVNEGFRVLRRLRTKLSTLGVEQKLLNRF